MGDNNCCAAKIYECRHMKQDCKFFEKSESNYIVGYNQYCKYEKMSGAFYNTCHCPSAIKECEASNEK